MLHNSAALGLHLIVQTPAGQHGSASGQAAKVAHLLQGVGGGEEREQLARGGRPDAHADARARQVRDQALLLALAPALNTGMSSVSSTECQQHVPSRCKRKTKKAKPTNA